MLRIRPAQFDAFERSALGQFEDATIDHLRGFAPAHARGLGGDGLRSVVRLGVERARRYGFTRRGPVRLFIELMVMFGSDFDTDPLLPWAAPGLRPGGGESARADRLHTAATAYRARVIGPDYGHEAAAIRRLLGEPVPAWLAGDHTGDGVAARMRAVYPEKCDAAGPAAVRAVVARGRRAAAAEGLPPAGGSVFAALMLAFGHGCAADPQFAWVAGSLRASAGQPGGRRVEKLATRAAAYLAAGLAAIERR